VPDSSQHSPGDILRRDVEALLFAAGRPLTTAELALASGSPTGEEHVAALLCELAREYPVDGPRGFELARVAGGWQLRTNRQAEPALSALFDTEEDPRLSPAAFEVLAIVAYLQPVSRPEIAEVRGVNSDSPVQTLVERELIVEVGRREGLGNAILYGTTERFQVAFGLEGLTDLPPLADFELDEQERHELKRRLGLIVSQE
jgi:segregation and condensation protein B